jgi:hypothetical protein
VIAEWCARAAGIRAGCGARREGESWKEPVRASLLSFAKKSKRFLIGQEVAALEATATLQLFSLLSHRHLTASTHGAPRHLHVHARAGPAEEEADDWAVDRATGLPEVWALVAVHLGLVGAWRLMRV